MDGHQFRAFEVLMSWKLSWVLSFLLFGVIAGHIFVDFSNYCPYHKCLWIEPIIPLMLMMMIANGWKGKRPFLILSSLNVVSCVTNDLNVISCCETQRIQFSRLGAIFLPHHFLRVKQVCASANGFWIIEPRSDPTTKEKSYICHWIED